MTYAAKKWPIPLETQPALLALGIGHHGAVAVERYTLGAVWCLHLYRYCGTLRVQDEEFPFRPGFASITPPHIVLEHRFDQPQCLHAFAHFSLPAVTAGACCIPVMQDVGLEFDRVNTAMEQAIGFFPSSPRRAEVRVWDILWQLTEHTQPADPQSRLHPAVQRTLETVELRLSEPLSVLELAQAVDLSPSHLSRLFRAEVGSTVVGYLQSRRLERARHLLVYSSLPPKAIAAQVGLPDLHQFNKALHRAFGRSPRAFRAEAQNKVQ